MPRFAYVSRNVQGRRVTAVAEAETRQQLLGELKARGLAVVDVQELDIAAAGSRRAPRAWALRGPDTGELAIFWREFATMVAAGLSVVESLESIAQELEHAKLRGVLTDIVSSMREGFNLSQSLKRHPRYFSTMIVALIGSAEESGSLSEIANQLAGYLENRDRLLRKVQAALTYPIFLVGFFLVVMAVATFWIIPKFRDIYAGFKAELPMLTQVVFAVNAWILHQLPWLAAGGLVAAVLLALWARRPSGRAALDRLGLRLPIFGPLLLRAAISRLARSLSVLLAGGIPVNRALEMAQHTTGNTVIAMAVSQVREEILQGGKIAASLKKHPALFPQMTIRMVAAGEETGSLAALLEKVADFYEARVDAALTTINTLIEPVMIICIGAFALIFVLSMYLPIFQLAATVRG